VGQDRDGVVALDLEEPDLMLEADSTRRDYPRWFRDTAGLLWVLAAGLAVFFVALRHGTSLGPYDLLSKYGLSQRPGVVVQNIQAADPISEMIPWLNLSWIQVHQGHLPLWNSYNALGLPLAFNWQSAVFSVPTLISYAAPLHLAYTVQTVLTVFIAGTGVYVFGRVLGLGVIASTFAAVAFELGGAFFTLTGWPLTSVASWGGWLLAGIVLVVKGKHRLRYVAFLAFLVACIVYAGQPDVLTVFAAALLGFVVVLLFFRTGSGPILRPILDMAIAVVGGLALAAPLMLPGLPLLNGSVRGQRAPYQALPARDLAHFLTSSFDGRPIQGQAWPGVGYLNSGLYIGAIALVLAVLAVARRRRQPEVRAVIVMTVAAGVVAFLPPVASLLGALPALKHVAWNYSLFPLGLGLAILSGIGLDVLIRSYRERGVRYLVGGGFIVTAVVIIVLWAFSGGTLTPRESTARSASLIWPAVESALGLVLIGVLAWVAKKQSGTIEVRTWPRVGWWVGVALLASETAFLVASGASWWSSTAQPFVPTPAVASLQRAVGSAIVGFGTNSCFVTPTVGILQESNIAFKVHEFDAYDPTTPYSYFSSWFATTGESAGAYVPPSAFCPAVNTSSAARLYGVGFVLEPHGATGPAGAVFVRDIGNEKLFKIQGASVATLVDLSSSGGLPPANAPGRHVRVTHPDPATWKLTTTSPQPQVLRLRLTNVPGWHGAIDGHPLDLQPFNQVMLQARIPPGRHVISLNYWPTSFTVGIVIALCSMLGFLVAGAASFALRRRPSPVAPTSSEPVPGS
jgi:Bacterial membrane protein YfhO